MKRRTFLASSAAIAAAFGLNSRTFGQPAESTTGISKNSHRPNRIAVATYSFWRFKDDLKLPIETCIDQAAEMGFDGNEDYKTAIPKSLAMLRKAFA